MSANDDTETVRCTRCGHETTFDATQLCDPCWQLQTATENAPEPLSVCVECGGDRDSHRYGWNHEFAALPDDYAAGWAAALSYYGTVYTTEGDRLALEGARRRRPVLDKIVRAGRQHLDRRARQRVLRSIIADPVKPVRAAFAALIRRAVGPAVGGIGSPEVEAAREALERDIDDLCTAIARVIERGRS